MNPASSTGELPYYLTVVQNIEEVYFSVDAEIWTEHFPETPPPCYEQALEMTAALASTTSEADTHNSEQESTENTNANRFC